MPKIAVKHKKTHTTKAHVGSGTAETKMKHGLVMSLNRLVVVAFIVVFGGIGAYFIISSFADSCTKTATNKCSTSNSAVAKQAAPIKAKPAPATTATPKQTAKTQPTPAKQAPTAAAPATSKTGTPAKAPTSGPTTPTCRAVDNGTCNGGIYTCSNSYKLATGQDGAHSCVKTTTSTPGAGTPSTAKPTAPKPAPVKVSCTKAVEGGHSCTDGTVRCEAGYLQRDTVCRKEDKSGCANIQNGKVCNGTTSCGYGYKAAKNANNSAYCAVNGTATVTCTPIKNGQKCNNNTVKCSAGYIQSGTDCTKANSESGCIAIENGKACTTGATCNSGYFANHTANGSAYCTKASSQSCTAVTHGQRCNNTVVCSAGYQLTSGVCTQSAPGTNCKDIKNGKTCNGQTSCDAGYQAASTVAGSPYCAVRTVTQVAGSTCVAVANGQKCTSNTTKVQTATCSYGYTATKTRAGDAYCAPADCTQVANGAKCGYVLTCMTGYIKSADAKTCVSSSSCSTTISNGKQCKDGTVLCASGYTRAATSKGQATCVKEVVTVPSGTVCQKNILNGKECTQNGKQVAICASGYSGAIVQTGPQAGSPYCAINSCTPTTHGNQCGKTLICADNYIKDASSKCVAVTCKNVAGGKTCTDGSLDCSKGYFEKSEKATSCTKITAKKISGGVSYNTGEVKCSKGYKLTTTKKSCAVDNTVVIAYSGYNDGCGGNATHYAANGKTHVNDHNYGKNSICKCSNGTTFAYGKGNTPVSDSHNASACGSSKPASHSSDGSSSSTSRGGGNASSRGSGGNQAACSSGWRTLGSGGGKTYQTCQNGRWASVNCPSGEVAVSSSSNNGPCKSRSTGKTSPVQQTRPSCHSATHGRMCSYPGGGATFSCDAGYENEFGAPNKPCVRMSCGSGTYLSGNSCKNITYAWCVSHGGRITQKPEKTASAEFDGDCVYAGQDYTISYYQWKKSH